MSLILHEIKTESEVRLYQIKRCEDYYSAWKSLNLAIAQYNKQICIAGDFFSVVYEALLNSMMAELIKLYDKHEDTLSVIKLLRKCQSTKEFKIAFCDISEKDARYRDTLAAFKCFMEEEATKAFLQNLIARRDKYYMHNDEKELDVQALINKYPFSFEEAEKLISEAKRFCEGLYQLSTNNEWIPFLYQKNRLEHVRDFSGLQKLLGTCHVE